jgi:uncharacterized repeat protein (TIGR03803 family)
MNFNRNSLSVAARICLSALVAAHSPLCFAVLSFKEVYRFNSTVPGPSGLTWGNDGALYGTCYLSGDYNLGWVFRVTTNGSLVALASFAGTNGAYPLGKLVLGTNGVFYGTTTKGGSADKGTIFSVSTNGALQMLAEFTGTNGPNFGEQPAGLCLSRDGAFYGCTSLGGNGRNTGTAYRITSDGSFTSLVTFSPTDHGGQVNGTLAEGPDTALYGTATGGGPAGYGTIFRLTSAGAVTVVAAFNGTNGAQPLAPVTVGADGALYGTTYFGGQDFSSSGRGTVFRCTIGGNLSTLHDFAVDPSVCCPQSTLAQDTNGILYGTLSYNASPNTYGTLFSISTNGDWTNLITFRLTNGTSFTDSPVLASDGSFYGTTGGGAALAGMVFRFMPGQDLMPVAIFRSGTNGTTPTSLLQHSDGLLYGTTTGGGTNNVGTVFCVSTNGSSLFSASLDPTIGSGPSSPLVAGPDGRFYGLAQQGGAYGYGSIYRITTSGALSAVGSFNVTNGSNPMGPFYIAPGGDIFGATYKGGAYNQGCLFHADTNGAISSLLSFYINGYPSDACFPAFGIMHGSDGAFYGTSYYGSYHPYGSAFKVTTNGVITLIAALYYPESTPFQASDGFFYGTTRDSFFRFTTNGGFSPISTFSSPWPQGSLTVGPDGAFYGEATSYGEGAIFRVTTNGLLRTLMNFNSFTTGASAYGGLILGQDNKLYGTTTFGQPTTLGPSFAGNIFSVDTSCLLNTPTPQASGMILSFSGMPNISYQIQRGPTPGGPWSNLAVVTLDSSGNGRYTNSPAPFTNAFYRMRVN